MLSSILKSGSEADRTWSVEKHTVEHSVEAYSRTRSVEAYSITSPQWAVGSPAAQLGSSLLEGNKVYVRCLRF